jgi:hypothetical protein
MMMRAVQLMMKRQSRHENLSNLESHENLSNLESLKFCTVDAIHC